MEDLDKKYIEDEETPEESEQDLEKEPETSEKKDEFDEYAEYMMSRPEVREAIRLAKDGLTMTEIASRLGRNRTTVARWLKKLHKAGIIDTLPPTLAIRSSEFKAPEVRLSTTTITKAPKEHGTVANERVARIVEKEITQEAIDKVVETLKVGRIVKEKVEKIAEAYGYSVDEVVDNAINFWLDWHGVIDDVREELRSKEEYIQVLEYLLSLRSDEFREAINQLLNEFHFSMLIKEHLPVFTAFLIYLGLPVREYLFEYVRYYLDVLKEVREYGGGEKAEGCFVEGEPRAG